MLRRQGRQRGADAAGEGGVLPQAGGGARPGRREGLDGLGEIGGRGREGAEHGGIAAEDGRGGRPPGDEYGARLVGRGGHGPREAARVGAQPEGATALAGRHYAVPDDRFDLGLGRVVAVRRQRQAVPLPANLHPAPGARVDLVDHHLDGGELQLPRREELVRRLQRHGVGQGHEAPVERARLARRRRLSCIEVRRGEGGRQGRRAARVGAPLHDHGALRDPGRARHRARGAEQQVERSERRRRPCLGGRHCR